MGTSLSENVQSRQVIATEAVSAKAPPESVALLLAQFVPSPENTTPGESLAHAANLLGNLRNHAPETIPRGGVDGSTFTACGVIVRIRAARVRKHCTPVEGHSTSLHQAINTGSYAFE